MEPNSTIKSVSATNETPLAKYNRWKQEITLAKKELEKWWTRAEKIIRVYSDERDVIETGDRKFNLFTANVDTLVSSMYANIPKVEVSRKFKDMDDDVSRVAANILERCLQCDLDEVDHNFDEVVRQAIWDRLVPGMGQAWLRIEGEMGEGQEIIIEHLHFKDFLWSPCRTWNERRWVAKRAYVDRDSGVARFGDVFKNVPLSNDDKKAERLSDNNDPKNNILEKAEVYEIWDNKSRKIIWLCPNYPQILDEQDDFLGLDNFEPCPRPLFASTTTSKVEPIPDYVKAQDQYEELNIINNRITLLTQACKVVGVYDKSASGIQRMLTEGYDNTLIPVDNWAMFAEGGGLKGKIDWLPLEMIVAAINQLSMAAEAKKQQIYELTGISDIVRGATKATETASAQKLKANFASARQQSMQQQIEGFVADILKLKAELLVKHFPPEHFIACSNIMSTIDAPLAQQAIMLLKNNSAVEYRISIKPESMAQVDYASEKQDRMELLTAIGIYIDKGMSMMQMNPLAGQLFIGMLKFAVAGFKAGKEFEGILDMQLMQLQQAQRQAQMNPQPPKPTPDEINAQTKAMESQAKIQIEQQKLQMEQQLGGVELQKAQMELQEAQILLATKQKELEIKDRELAIKEAELDLKVREAVARINLDKEVADNDFALKLADLHIGVNKTIKDHEIAMNKDEDSATQHYDKMELEHKKVNSDKED